MEDLILKGIPIFISLLSLVLSVFVFSTRKKYDDISLHVNWNKEIISWATKVIDELGRAVSLLEKLGIDSTYNEIVFDLIQSKQRMSSLLDNGRLFLPNVHHQDVGGHKEGAYRGVRQKALDCIYFAFDRLKYVIDVNGECNYKDVIGQLIQCRRHFVSEIQEKIGSRFLEKNAVVGVYRQGE